MKIFRDFTIKWWQGSLLKLSMFSFGIVVGVRWADKLGSFTTPLLIFFILSAVYLSYAVLSKKV